MKRSFQNLFVIFMILISLIGSSIQATSVDALAYPGTNTAVSLPASWQTAKLIDVWGYDASNIYIAGYGTVSGSTMPVIYKKNGTAWDPSTPGLPTAPGTWTSGSLKAVWGANTTDIYAAGNGTSSGATLPVIYKKNGTAWDPSSPDLPVTEGEPWIAGFLEDVWGPSASDVYTVGYGSTFGAPTKPLVYRSTDGGTTWNYSLPSLPASWNGYLYSVWGSAANDVYVVGYGNEGTTTVPLIYRSTNNGSTWSQTILSLPTGWSNGSLYSIWGSAANDIYVVGSGSNGTDTVPLVYHYNGSSWVLSNPLPLMPSNWDNTTLTSVWGSGGVVYAAGYGDNADTITPLIYRKTSSGWAASIPAMNGWDSRYLESMWGSDAYNMYFVGYGDTPTDIDQPLLYYAGNDTTAPGAVTNLAATSGIYSGTVDLSWTAPADDAGNNNSGPVDSYVVKYSTSSLADCSGGTQVTNGLPVPATPGNTQTMTVSGLTRGTLYYFAICAKDEENNPSSPVTISAIATLNGAGTYDDADTAWSYMGSWTTYAGAGPMNNTMHYTNVQNASASITFTGMRFKVWFMKHPNRGNVEVWIDGTLQYTFSENGSSQAWQQSWTLPASLSQGTHTVQFKNPNASTSTYIDIDAIEIIGPPVPVGPGTYDDADAAWSYTGSWTTYAGAGPMNNTMHYTNVQNASASITFTGTGFKVWFMKHPNRGNVEVWIDGTLQYTFSENGSSQVWQQNWTLPASLSQGTHTVQFKNPNASTSTYIDIDAITIIDITTAVGVGTYDDANAAWSYMGSWTTYAGAGPMNNTMHYTNVQNASASITFTGTRFKVWFMKHPNRGNVEVWIDGQYKYTFSEYGSSQAWQQSWTLPVSLSQGTYTVQFKNPNASTGTYIDIDAIEILGPPPPVGPGTYDDADAAWSYTGSWTTYTGTGPMNNTMHYTNVQNSGASITFTGTGFKVWFAKHPNRGNVEVWIDGTLQYTFSENGSSLTWQQSWTLPTPLSNGTHTVMFKNPSPSSYIDVDAIAIQAPVGTGMYDDANAAWSYTGSWTTYTGTGPMNNTMHYTNIQNSSASITFTGTQFTVWFTKHPNRGNVEVWIDGILQYTFSENGSSQAWQQSWALPTPLGTVGPHVVTFKNPNASTSTYIDIDAILIQ